MSKARLSAQCVACLRDCAGGPITLSEKPRPRDAPRDRRFFYYSRHGAGEHQALEILTLGALDYLDGDGLSFWITDKGRAALAAIDEEGKAA